MPTYLVSTAAARLIDERKRRIADGITQAHSQATGAQGFFVQVIFNDIPAGNHFIGGRPLDAEQIFVQATSVPAELKRRSCNYSNRSSTS
jgi:phenylpyruvate tautomerase PptA (4-oxalocrotonate tautomerase family)